MIENKENPSVELPNNYITDCLVKYTIGGITVTSYEHHPGFTAMRKELAKYGFIEIPAYPCWNGDRVTKRFVFNNYQLEPGDKFYCAAAWSNHFNFWNFN